MITGWRAAAQTGNIEALYASIEEDGDVLKRIDEVEFVDTPLHIAAAAGHTDFVMEMINLKPSFAKKLNQLGFSTLHLALQNGHNEMVLRLLEINKDLVRVKGKGGCTPLHYVIRQGKIDLLTKFLEDCPECIFDVTIQNQTVFHLAVENNKVDTLSVLSAMLQNSDHCQDVVNRKDSDGNTALHRAAANSNPEMLQLLLASKADKNVTNRDGLRALDVARCQVSIDILRDSSLPGVSTLGKLWQPVAKILTKEFTKIFHEMDSISSADRNALLVILGLLLTATYQAALSPPGGVSQGEGSHTLSSPPSAVLQQVGAPASTPIPTRLGKSRNKAGKSVLDPFNFLVLYLTTYAIFTVAFFLTLGLLKPLPRSLRTALHLILALFALCFQMSIFHISPPKFYMPMVIDSFCLLVFTIMMYMSNAPRVLIVGVAVLAFWFIWDFFL